MITSFRHDKEKIANRRRLLGALFLVAILFLLLRRPIEGALSSFFLQITRPIFVAEYGVKEWWQEKKILWTSMGSLVEENRRLKESLDLVSLEAYSRTQLRDENDQLKAMLGRKAGRVLLLARVLATPGRSPYDTLIVDVGKNDGITPGMKVFVGGDFVLGEVSKVVDQSATVTLYSSYGNELPVTVGSSSVPAIARGEGGGNFRITLPRGLLIAKGDLVNIPALAPQYAGVVEAVDRPEGGSLQDIYLRWPFNVNELVQVYIATDEGVPVVIKKKSP